MIFQIRRCLPLWKGYWTSPKENCNAAFQLSRRMLLRPSGELSVPQKRKRPNRFSHQRAQFAHGREIFVSTGWKPHAIIQARMPALHMLFLIFAGTAGSPGYIFSGRKVFQQNDFVMPIFLGFLFCRFHGVRHLRCDTMRISTSMSLVRLRVKKDSFHGLHYRLCLDWLSSFTSGGFSSIDLSWRIG